MAEHPSIRRAIELLEAADHDLAAYRAAPAVAPNRLNAGRAALHSLEEAEGLVAAVRSDIVAELVTSYASWDRPDVQTQPDVPAGDSAGHTAR